MPEVAIFSCFFALHVYRLRFFRCWAVRFGSCRFLPFLLRIWSRQNTILSAWKLRSDSRPGHHQREPRRRAGELDVQGAVQCAGHQCEVGNARTIVSLALAQQQGRKDNNLVHVSDSQPVPAGLTGDHFARGSVLALQQGRKDDNLVYAPDSHAVPIDQAIISPENLVIIWPNKLSRKRLQSRQRGHGAWLWPDWLRWPRLFGH